MCKRTKHSEPRVCDDMEMDDRLISVLQMIIKQKIKAANYRLRSKMRRARILIGSSAGWFSAYKIPNHDASLYAYWLFIPIVRKKRSLTVVFSIDFIANRKTTNTATCVCCIFGTPKVTCNLIVVRQRTDSFIYKFVLCGLLFIANRIRSPEIHSLNELRTKAYTYQNYYGNNKRAELFKTKMRQYDGQYIELITNQQHRTKQKTTMNSEWERERQREKARERQRSDTWAVAENRFFSFFLSYENRAYVNPNWTYFRRTTTTATVVFFSRCRKTWERSSSTLSCFLHAFMYFDHICGIRRMVLLFFQLLLFLLFLVRSMAFLASSTASFFCVCFFLGLLDLLLSLIFTIKKECVPFLVSSLWRTHNNILIFNSRKRQQQRHDDTVSNSVDFSWMNIHRSLLMNWLVSLIKKKQQRREKTRRNSFLLLIF